MPPNNNTNLGGNTQLSLEERVNAMPPGLTEIFVFTSSHLGSSCFWQLKSLLEDNGHVTEPLFLSLETISMEYLFQEERFTKSANWGRAILTVSRITVFFALHIQFSQKKKLIPVFPGPANTFMTSYSN